ncbi:SDR family NAD(P)-dependent oxidoreductase [Spirilliplanes yamanashiensis]|uniref:Oxidoreductase n=1 Tax=Spirilliplanes yamanashiensis TaxID=42233 RepID=A0A8J4DHI7_9ACTN|nr:SDR family oxidoreductase [Spirilliplanes yamanashiensis]MDP9819291.1 3-oxoacyl-[acyl-carrier protein] reductase [Spirilliplanes yamanashiensis]GIJ01886.1 oxidoreductase [Spirilliplanes yamanashiensis]
MSVALVTGSAGAIGAAIGRALAAAGHHVIGADLRPDPAAPWRTVVARLDDPAEAAAALADAAADGPVTTLVNNAGVYLARDFLTTTPEEFDAVLGANVRSAFFCAQHAARALIAAGTPGTIVNIASVSGRTGSADAAYGASKGAVIALTKSLATALAPHRITVNAVAPGLIDSDMSRRIPADRQRAYRSRIPLGRFGRPEEVAAVVAALAGDAGSYLTGSVVDVNGGLW